MRSNSPNFMKLFVALLYEETGLVMILGWLLPLVELK